MTCFSFDASASTYMDSSNTSSVNLNGKAMVEAGQVFEGSLPNYWVFLARVSLGIYSHADRGLLILLNTHWRLN
jgi:hypothetical protein